MIASARKCDFRDAAIAAVLAVACFAVLGRILANDFINYDDDRFVTANAAVQAGLGGEGIRYAFTTNEEAYYIPLSWLSHMLDCTLFGLSPAGHHLTSLILHAINTVLLFFVLLRITRARWPSALVAALFALHPLHVESVAWVSERKDVLSGLFFMLTLAAYGGYAKRPSATRYLLVTLLFALGLLAKPMLVTLPCVLLLLDAWPLGRFETCRGFRPMAGRLGWLALEKAPLLILSAAACSAALWMQKDSGDLHVPVLHRLANASVVYVIYLLKMVCPSGLAVFYPYPAHVQPWWQIAAACALLGIITAAVLAARRKPYLAAGWFWYFGMLVPVMQVAQTQPFAYGYADRYTYLPLIGIFLMLAFGARDLAAALRFPRGARFAVAAIVLAALAAASFAQAGRWRNSVTLFEHTLAVTQENAPIHANLGATFALQDNYGAAIRHFEQALDIDPALPDVHYNLAEIALQRRDFAKAARHYSETLRIIPENPAAHAKLAYALFALNRRTEAAQHAREALRLDPQNTLARRILTACAKP